MPIEVKHATQATGTDAGNGEIRKTQWNEGHTLSMDTNKLLGRSTAGAGAAEEISIGSGLSLSAGTLSATGGGSSTLTFNNITAAYTVVASDLGKIINCTSGTFTVSLTSTTTLGTGFSCWIWNTSSTATDVITIDPNAAETIDGAATLLLRRGEGVQIITRGPNWETGDKKTMRAYAENLLGTGTRPIASGSNSVALMNNSTASSDYALALGFIATVNGAESLATHRSTAGSNYSVALGENSAQGGAVTASGAGAMALGGSYASGTDSFAAAIANNTSSFGATGANSIAIGQQARATSSYAVSIGWANVAGNRSVCIGGNTSTASDNSVVMGSWSSTISAAYSATLGGGFASDRGQQNRWAYGLVASPGLGMAQRGDFILYRQTADATPTVLRSNSGASPSTNNIPVLSNNCAYAFTGTVVALQQGSAGNQSAAWKIEGLIRRDASAITTTLVASTVTAISNTPGWTLALSANTTLGGLAVTATGAAATNIRWVANIQSSEVVFA